MRGISIRYWLNPDWRTLCSASEALSHFKIAEKSGTGRSGRHSKIKDRLEALLFAETLQGTLSPNANPRKGVRWRLTEFDAASTREDSADYSDTSSLVLDLIVIPK